MNLALAHEYFVAHGGAERVVEVFHEMWPEAPVYTFFHDRRRYGDLPGWNLRTSYLQWLLLGESHRLLLPLYPNAARALRVPPETDVALVSTSAFIKEIGLADRTVAVAYCHSPTRYLYDWSDRYLQEEVPQPLIPLVRDLLGRTPESMLTKKIDDAGQEQSPEFLALYRDVSTGAKKLSRSLWHCVFMSDASARAS